MNLADGRLAPTPGGDGLVARTPGAVLFVAARTPADDVALLVDALHGATGPTPARDLARAFARVVSDDADSSLPGFAVVADTGSGAYVRVYGAVEVELQGDDGVEVLSGVGSYTGVDRELPGPFHTIVGHRAGEPAPAPAFDVDLGSGSVPASGFALSTMSSPTDAVIAEIPPAMDEQVAASDDAAPSEGAPAEAPGAAALDLDPQWAPGGAAPLAAPLEQPTQAWSPEDVDAATGASDLEAGEPAVVEPPVAEGVPAPDLMAEPPAMAGMAEPPTTVAPPAGEDAHGGAEAVPADAPSGLDDLPVVEVPDEPAPPADMAGAEVRSLEELPIADEPPAAGAEPPAGAGTPEEPTGTGAAEPASAEPVAPAASDPGAAGGFTSQLLGALDIDEVDERDALPIELEPGEVRQADQVTSEVVVQGIVCSRGHFNDPRSRYCSSCGISMVQVTNVLTNGPRPPLGVMVFEDGAAFSLSTDYVVGRQPEVSELVRDGLALPLTVDDPERSISRAHAELRLVDWDVHLVNLSGTNGSFVWDEAAQQWITIPEGQSVVLTPGMRVALGRRSAVFESSLR